MNRGNVGVTTIVDLRNDLRLTKTVPIKIELVASPWDGDFVNSIQIFLCEGYYIDIQVNDEIFDLLSETAKEEEK